MAWICGQCRTLSDNHLTACSLCGTPRPAAAVAADAGMHDADFRDLVMEGHLRALSIWHRIGGVIGFVFAVLLLLAGTKPGSDSPRMMGINEGLRFLGIFFLLPSVGGFILGHFLGRFANAARITAGVFAALGTAGLLLNTCGGSFVGRSFNFGVVLVGGLGLAWCAAVLWALWNRRAAEVCTERYRELRARTADLRPRTFQSVFFWLPLVATVLTFTCGGLLLFGARNY